MSRIRLILSYRLRSSGSTFIYLVHLISIDLQLSCLFNSPTLHYYISFTRLYYSQVVFIESPTFYIRIAYKRALISFPHLHYSYSFSFPPPSLEVDVPPIAAYLGNLRLPTILIITQNGNKAALYALIIS